jgi:hypothetical protein
VEQARLLKLARKRSKPYHKEDDDNDTSKKLDEKADCGNQNGKASININKETLPKNDESGSVAESSISKKLKVSNKFRLLSSSFPDHTHHADTNLASSKKGVLSIRPQMSSTEVHRCANVLNILRSHVHMDTIMSTLKVIGDFTRSRQDVSSSS